MYVNIDNHVKVYFEVIMNHADLIAYYGSGDKAAQAVQTTRQAVHMWKANGIPIAQQIKYELATKGALRASLPREIRERTA